MARGARAAMAGRGARLSRCSHVARLRGARGFSLRRRSMHRELCPPLGRARVDGAGSHRAARWRARRRAPRGRGARRGRPVVRTLRGRARSGLRSASCGRLGAHGDARCVVRGFCARTMRAGRERDARIRLRARDAHRCSLCRSGLALGSLLQQSGRTRMGRLTACGSLARMRAAHCRLCVPVAAMGRALTGHSLSWARSAQLAG